MKRREVLKYTAYLTGGILSIPLVSSLSGCKGDHISVPSSYTFKYFAKEDITLLQELVDIILPKTDSPSASEVGVHKIIDSMVGTVYGTEAKEKYSKGWSQLKKSLNDPSPFSQLPTTDKLSKVNNIYNSSDNPTKSAFDELRQQTIAYYLSTEEVGTNHLNYLPVPGEYQGCIELSSVGGKLWTL